MATPSIPVVQVGVNTPGAIATPNSVDLHEVDLIGGVTYAFLAAGSTEGGGTLHDPVMGVFSSDFKTAFTVQDNSILSLDPLILFTAPATGTYGIAVASAEPGHVGSYHLDVTPAGPPVTFGGPLGQI
jgi:hypothetical protein